MRKNRNEKIPVVIQCTFLHVKHRKMQFSTTLRWSCCPWDQFNIGVIIMIDNWQHLLTAQESGLKHFDNVELVSRCDLFQVRYILIMFKKI